MSGHPADLQLSLFGDDGSARFVGLGAVAGRRREPPHEGAPVARRDARPARVASVRRPHLPDRQRQQAQQGKRQLDGRPASYPPSASSPRP